MRKLTTEEFIIKAKNIHGNKYDYSETLYLDSTSKIRIKCHKYGFFKQKPYDHLNGCGCQNCRSELISDLFRSNTIDFIKKAEKIHGKKYDYNRVEYSKVNENVVITCQLHGDFKQRPHIHLKGSGCPKCNESKGEKKIRKYLIKNGIYYMPQKKFTDCKNINHLPFDFYIPSKNLLIEYDGRQHFENVWGVESLEKTKFNDKIKNEFVEKHEFNLIRISYKDYYNIENILNKI